MLNLRLRGYFLALVAASMYKMWCCSALLRNQSACGEFADTSTLPFTLPVIRCLGKALRLLEAVTNVQLEPESEPAYEPAVG